MRSIVFLIVVLLPFTLFSQSYLGEYLSIKGHSKSKDVDLKLRVPMGWDVQEGDRPNVVKKFTKDENAYVIIIKENVTFFSRARSKELLEDESFSEDFILDLGTSVKNLEIINKSVVTIDSYPALQIKVRGEFASLGLTIPVIIKCWLIFFEDKTVLLQATGTDPNEFASLEQLYFLITSSVIFPEQYN